MLDIKIPKIYLFEPFLWIYSIWLYLPIARAYFRSSTYNLLFFALFICGCGILVLMFAFSKKKVNYRFNVLYPVIAYLIVILGLVVLGIGTAHRHIRISYSFWLILVAYFLTTSYPDAQKRITKLLFVLFIITTLTSLIGVIVNPSAARTLTFAGNSIEDDLVIKKLNIGGISFFQGLVVCVPILVTLIIKKQYVKQSIIMLVVVFASVFSASFTITLIMFFVALVLGYLANNTSTQKAVMSVLFAAILFVVPWQDVFESLARLIDNEFLSEHFASLASSLSGRDAYGNTESREKLYEISIKTFLAHPFGVGPEYTYVNFLNGIGYHSQILDDLARYGCFAIAFYVSFFIGYYNLLKEQWGKVDLQQVAFPVAIVYFLFLLLNPGFTSEHESILLLFLMPALPSLLNNNQNENERDLEVVEEEA